MANFIPDPKACAATLAAWSNAIAAINAYCTSVRALTMPAASALSRVDSSVFNDLSQHVDQAHLVGGIWLVSVKAASNAAPSAFTDANSVVSLFFTNANTAATALLQNPADKEALAALESSVAAAQNDLKGVIANVQETETLIQRWATALNSSIDGFQSSLGDVTALYSAVQSDYTTLGNTISELRSKISTFNALVPAEAIGSAVAVISSATYIPLMMSWNPFVGGIFAIGLFIAFTEAELAAAAQAEEVQQLQDQLQQDAAEQSDDVKALASLLNTSALLNELSQEATSLIAADGPVSTVEAMLETLISGTQAVLSELTDAAQAANTGQIQQTASDLASAQATWNAVVALAQTYSSNLSFNVQLTSVSVINAGTVTQVSMPT